VSLRTFPAAGSDPRADARPRRVGEVLEQVRSEDVPSTGRRSPVTLCFDLVDRILDGGLRAHDLLLLGGSPGVGKTVAALQMARHVAMCQRPAIYVSYEHDEATMLGRLLVLELAEHARPEDALELDRLRSDILAAVAGFQSLDELIEREPLLGAATERVAAYDDRLWFVRGSGMDTDVVDIEALLGSVDLERDGVLFIDYLQKVAVRPDPSNEAEKITRVVEALKDLALRHTIAVVAVVAAGWDGVSGGRVRLHHLRGSSALAYECDVAIMMNDKHGAVAKVHLEYDPVKAETFRRQVVFSVEKNRGGLAGVDVEYQKDFPHYRFLPSGRHLTEQLRDGTVQL
jgi:replicative DNA helicase